MKDDWMPQLMPLMWYISIMMSLFLVFVLVDLYYYKKDNLMEFNKDFEINKVLMKW